MTRAYVGNFEDAVFLNANPLGEYVSLSRSQMMVGEYGMDAWNDLMIMPPEYARDLASQLMNAAAKAEEFRKASLQRASQQE